MKKFLSKILLLIAITLVSWGSQAQNSAKVKYVFLFIGDGMGISQVFVTEKYNALTNAEPLIFMNDRWTFGLSMTECADSNKITDSGAGGTAIACGERTSFGNIGEYKGKALESIAEYLHTKMNFKIGIITSVPLNHATPSCFFGHEPTRRNYDNLTNDMIQSGFELFAGGGFQLGNADSTKNIFKNSDAIYKKLSENNFQLVFNEKQLSALSSPSNCRVLIIDTAIQNNQKKLKINYSDEKNSLPCILDEPGCKMKLAEYTESAQNLLMNDNGFFIMVEGGKIDWACHDNDALTAIYEINAFNEAIKKAYAFYLKHPQNTLIIITADHETGGMAQGARVDGKTQVKKDSYGLFIKKLQLQTKSYIYTSKDSLQKIQKEAQIGWATYEHSSAPVGVWAIGNGSEKFSGIMKNSDIKEKILNLVR